MSPKSKEGCKVTNGQQSLLWHKVLKAKEYKMNLKTYCMFKRLILLAVK